MSFFITKIYRYFIDIFSILFISAFIYVSFCHCSCAPQSAGLFLNLILHHHHLIMWSKRQKSSLTYSLYGNERGLDYENNPSPAVTNTHQEQMGGPWFLCSLLSFLCKLCGWPEGLVKDRDGDGKHIKIRSGWLDATFDFHSVIEELLWVTLSLTSVWWDEDGSKWLQC